MKCVKYLLFLFNLIFFIAGLGLIILGAVVQTNFREYFAFFTSGTNLNSAAILLIVVGCIIFIIGFFGCCGAYKENYCMTMTFAVLLGIIFVLEIAAGITAYILRDQVRTILQDGMTKALVNYDRNSYEGVTKAWNVLQTNFKCCGVEDYQSWKNNTLMNTNQTVPRSCCINESDDPKVCNPYVLKPNADKSTIYQNGCLAKFVHFAQQNVYIVGGVGIGLAFVQIIGIILACCLARTIKKEYEVV